MNSTIENNIVSSVVCNIKKLDFGLPTESIIRKEEANTAGTHTGEFNHLHRRIGRKYWTLERSSNTQYIENEICV